MSYLLFIKTSAPADSTVVTIVGLKASVSGETYRPVYGVGFAYNIVQRLATMPTENTLACAFALPSFSFTIVQQLATISTENKLNCAYAIPSFTFS